LILTFSTLNYTVLQLNLNKQQNSCLVIMSDTPTQTQRYVPGAPPPPPPKTSKKKRKPGKGGVAEDSPALSSVAIPDAPSPALPEKVPDASDAKDGPGPDSSLADPRATNGSPSGQHVSDETKHSPIVDLIQKRIKASTKKIVRRLLRLTGL
jgi:hypothetical protein